MEEISELRKKLELDDYIKTDRITYYLISLFYRSGRKYHCSPSKINRLLTIYKLCCVKCDPNCFHFSFTMDLSYLIVGIPSMPTNWYLPIVCYKDLVAEVDDKQEFVDEFGDFDLYNGLAEIAYRRYDSIKDEVSLIEKDLLEIIFRKFGSYPTGDLARMINELKDIPFRKKVDEVNFTYASLDVDEFLEFLNSKENNKLYENNEVFKFIRDFNNIFKEKGIIDKNDYLSGIKVKIKK